MNKDTLLQVLIPLLAAAAVVLGIQVTTPELTEIVGGIVVVAGSIYAVWQRNGRVAAEVKTNQVINFYDPESEVTVPPVALPARSYLMNEETKNWVLTGHDALNQMSLLQQIAANESSGKLHYFISFSDRGGGFYEIEYGLMRGSGVGVPPKPDEE